MYISSCSVCIYLAAIDLIPVCYNVSAMGKNGESVVHEISSILCDKQDMPCVYDFSSGTAVTYN